jgi:uncharacterized RDD family membrane protein YckC
MSNSQTLSVHDRTDEFLTTIRRRRLAIVTPEGVKLNLELAGIGERAGAFLIDFALIVAAVIVLTIGVRVVAGVGLHARLVVAIVALIAFLVRTLYFVRFELAWQGSTPGKRAVGLRIIDHNGGPLLPGAVITRNIMREVETFLPLGVLLTLNAPGIGWEKLGLALWMLILAAVPCFTRQRQRIGDFLAGTAVIAVPKRVLAPDLAVAGSEFSFTERQLRSYGAFELQVLEEILRRRPGPETTRLDLDVATRICKRIEAPVPPAEACHRFLVDFYAAQRAHLEREQLFGRLRETKAK